MIESYRYLKSLMRLSSDGRLMKEGFLLDALFPVDAVPPGSTLRYRLSALRNRDV